MERPQATIDHIAIPSNNIADSVKWYVDHFGASVLYIDETWAFLKFRNVKLALVTPSQHPPHVAMSVNADELASAAEAQAVDIDKHRDGTQGIYIADPDGNAIELIYYPKGETKYAERDKPTTK